MQTISKDDFVFANKYQDISIDNTFAGESFFKEGVKKFLGKRTNIIGLAVLILLTSLAFLVPLMSGQDYITPFLERADMAPRIPGIVSGTEYLKGTGGSIRQNRYEELGLKDTYYFFGTDSMGRDLFVRTFAGLRVSLFIAFVSAVINFVIGMNYGMISGFMGGKVDLVMQRIIDILGSIPTLVIVTLLMLVLKPGIGSIIIAMMLTGWMDMSMVARARVLKLKEMEFVLASRTLGANSFYIITRDLLPNTLGTLITQIMVTVPNAIFLETFLSFVGLGMPLGSCSLGRIISDGFNNCLLHPYKLFPSVLILTILMIACNILADGLKEAFDPSVR
ncbi:MAG: ABC transporter permease [Lachnospiraceae bacterium]|nr:ABC transporter permease [Lachnospiraceae bacterium]